MCDMDEKVHIFYYEDENLFIDEEGEVIYDIFSYITPQNLYMFHHDWGIYDEFLLPGFTTTKCQIIVVPEGEICSLKVIPNISARLAYHQFEFHERTKMAKVGG